MNVEKIIILPKKFLPEIVKETAFMYAKNSRNELTHVCM